MDERYLSIYMNDQLAMGVGWRELAKRAHRNNEGTDLGDALGRVARGIGEDVASFEDMMQRLGMHRGVVKPLAAMAAERVARLKLNGRVRGYSPLSRFIELDILAMGIDGKKLLWTTLRDLANLRQALPDVDFTALIERADQQRAEIEPFRRRAGIQAFHGDAD
jgi:hypothetical protein